VLTLYRPYLSAQDRTLLATRHAQASPGHAALCPTMLPVPTTDPPWSSLDAPSSSTSRVGPPGVRVDRFAWLRQPRLRPGGLPQVLQIPPRDGHLPFSATVRIQLDRRVFHLRENSTAGHTSTSSASAIDQGEVRQRPNGYVGFKDQVYSPLYGGREVTMAASAGKPHSDPQAPMETGG